MTIVLALAALAPPARAAGSGEPTHIVQLRHGVSFAEGRALVRAAHGRVTATLPIIHGLAVRLPAGARARVAHDAAVAAVSRNAPIRSQDTVSSVTSTVTATVTSTVTSTVSSTVAGIDTSLLVPKYPFAVRAPRVWSQATGAGVGVAVIDTGVDGGLPDFADADGNSRVVASVVTDPGATTAADTYGHGTHVAGIIAGDGTKRPADDPAAGQYVGIAPQANLVAIKASDDAGQGTILDAIYGLQFAVDHKEDYNIRVVNLSFSSTVAESYHTDPLDAAVEAAYFHGILVVAAAGNRGTDDDAVDYAPGNDPFALSVGAVDDRGTFGRGDDALTDWSSRGTTQDRVAKPEVVAPGAHIVSTLAPGSFFADQCPDCIVGDEYIRLGGTSMAAPVVSGVAALLFQAQPKWTPGEMKATLIRSANSSGALREVNAAAAIAATTPWPSADADTPPNDLVDPDGGDIDYARSSWGRSSWGAAPEGLVADWARSSWGCLCSAPSASDSVDSTRSSWGSATWLVRWG
jgi:serine protease AprX